MTLANTSETDDAALMNEALLHYREYLEQQKQQLQDNYPRHGKAAATTEDLVHDRNFDLRIQAIEKRLLSLVEPTTTPEPASKSLVLDALLSSHPNTSPNSSYGCEDEPYVNPFTGQWITPVTPFTPGPSTSGVTQHCSSQSHPDKVRAALFESQPQHNNIRTVPPLADCRSPRGNAMSPVASSAVTKYTRQKPYGQTYPESCVRDTKWTSPPTIQSSKTLPSRIPALHQHASSKPRVPSTSANNIHAILLRAAAAPSSELKEWLELATMLAAAEHQADISLPEVEKAITFGTGMTPSQDEKQQFQLESDPHFGEVITNTSEKETNPWFVEDKYQRSMQGCENWELADALGSKVQQDVHTSTATRDLMRTGQCLPTTTAERPSYLPNSIQAGYSQDLASRQQATGTQTLGAEQDGDDMNAQLEQMRSLRLEWEARNRAEFAEQQKEAQWLVDQEELLEAEAQLAQMQSLQLEWEALDMAEIAEQQRQAWQIAEEQEQAETEACLAQLRALQSEWEAEDRAELAEQQKQAQLIAEQQDRAEMEYHLAQVRAMQEEWQTHDQRELMEQRRIAREIAEHEDNIELERQMTAIRELQTRWAAEDAEGTFPDRETLGNTAQGGSAEEEPPAYQVLPPGQPPEERSEPQTTFEDDDELSRRITERRRLQAQWRADEQRSKEAIRQANEDVRRLKQERKRQAEQQRQETLEQERRVRQAECLACTETLDKSVMAILPCEHAYCRGCITGMYSLSTSCLCPTKSVADYQPPQPRRIPGCA